LELREQPGVQHASVSQLFGIRLFERNIMKYEAPAASHVRRRFVRLSQGNDSSRLTKRAPSYFPPPSHGIVEIGNLSLVQVIRAMQTEQSRVR
jgi:deferrochelatase/peroxidase EfeB